MKAPAEKLGSDQNPKMLQYDVNANLHDGRITRALIAQGLDHTCTDARQVPNAPIAQGLDHIWTVAMHIRPMGMQCQQRAG